METTSNRSVQAALYRAMEALCNGAWSAVRVACVPNGTESRFVVRIEPEWRSQVYAYLAENSAIRIPVDGGALNLSYEEAVQVGAMQVASVPTETPRPARRIAPDLKGDGLRHTFQP